MDRRCNRYAAAGVIMMMSWFAPEAIAQNKPAPPDAPPNDAPGLSRYDHHALVRAHITSQAGLDAMISFGAIPWECVIAPGTQEFSVSPEALGRLRTSNIRFEIVNNDIGPLVRSDVQRMQDQMKQGGAGGIAGVNWFDDYKTYPQVNDYIDSLVALRPDLISKLTVGTTIEGRTIYGMRITAPPPPPGNVAGDTASKTAIIFSGCQHAREWIAVMVPMYIADTLVRNYDTDPQINDLMNRIEFFIVPIVNADGYEFTYALDGDRFWRKNRRDNGEGIFGVDLNRNWGVDWGGLNSTSTDPNSQVYIGTGAFSEPETSAVRDFIIAHPQIAGHIDFHSFAQLILENWAYVNAAAPDYDLIDAIGADMNQQLFAINSMNYENGWGAALLYLASGVFPDWCYGERGILGYTIELRDNGQYGFVLPPDQIIPTCTEALPAALRFADWSTRSAAYFFPRGLPQVVNTAAPTMIQLNIQGIAGAMPQPATARLFARIGSSGPFSSSLLTPNGGTSYQAVLPAAPCGQVIQYYFQAQTESGATISSPVNAPASFHQASAANPIINYNFEVTAGWSVQNAGATSGQWQRGVPVNDPSWLYDPANDADGSGQCYLTQNTAGQFTDVSNGSVRLTSPTLNLAAISPRPVISYAYYLHLTTPGGADPMVVEISSNDLVGPWTEIARHDTSGSGHWRWNKISSDALAALGVNLTAAMRIRFTVTDGNPQTIVEAAVDGVRISTDCGGPPPPQCPADIGPSGGDGTVNVADLLAVINSWGPCLNCAADIAPAGGDGTVNAADLLLVINSWGPCP